MTFFISSPHRCEIGLFASFAFLLAGCHSQPAAHLAAPTPAFIASSPNVQQDAAYKRAITQFSNHDYSGALGNISMLLGKPQYGRDPAEHAFLLHQQAICRHAINPRVPVDVPPVSSVPVLSAHAPLTAAQADCGPRALLLLCPQFGVHTNLVTLRQKAGTTAKGTTMEGLVHAAQSVGLKAKGIQVDKQALAQVALPAIVWYDGNHFINLLSVSEQQATIRDPNQPKEETIPTNELLGRSSGILLTISR